MNKLHSMTATLKQHVIIVFVLSQAHYALTCLWKNLLRRACIYCRCNASRLI